jgi:hypothetical protein
MTFGAKNTELFTNSEAVIEFAPEMVGGKTCSPEGTNGGARRPLATVGAKIAAAEATKLGLRVLRLVRTGAKVVAVEPTKLAVSVIVPGITIGANVAAVEATKLGLSVLRLVRAGAKVVAVGPTAGAVSVLSLVRAGANVVAVGPVTGAVRVTAPGVTVGVKIEVAGPNNEGETIVN